MNRLFKGTVVAGFTLWMASSLTAGSARAAPGWVQEKQQEEETKREKRVHIVKTPCVFVSSSHKRGTLGVQLTNLTPDLRAHFGAPKDIGVMISGITTGSPAEKAGLQVGDIITSVDGEDVESSSDVARRIRGKQQGEVAEIHVLRDKTSLTLEATIEESERAEVDLGDFFRGDCDEFQFAFDFDEEAVKDAIENATRHLRNPEFLSQWKWAEHFSEAELQEKLKELEKKLEKMEKELEGLEFKKKQLEEH
jgi:hypothetical protein